MRKDLSDEDALTTYDDLCREVYADDRLPAGTQEVALAMGWVMYRHPDRPNGAPFWKSVRRMLRANAIGQPRLWDLIAADAPRYVQPGVHWSIHGDCEGPRIRPYRPRRDAVPSDCIVHPPPGGWPEPHDPTHGGRVCGAEGTIRVVEADMVTGWTQTRWFCRRHAARAREVKAQLAARGEPPPPIPNVGGLLPCYFKADWDKVYCKAVERALHGPTRWERPYHGLCADEWPVPGKQPIPRRPRLSVVPA